MGKVLLCVRYEAIVWGKSTVTFLLGYRDNVLFFVWYELTDGGSQTSAIPKIHGRPKLLLSVGYRLITYIKVTEFWVWHSCDRASLMYSFKYNQHAATLYNILYYCQCSTCFRQFPRPSSGAQNCTHSIWYMSNLLAATASMGEFQAWHIPDAVCTVLSSWWWAGKPPEALRTLTVIKNIV